MVSCRARPEAVGGVESGGISELCELVESFLPLPTLTLIRRLVSYVMRFVVNFKQEEGETSSEGSEDLYGDRNLPQHQQSMTS